MNVTSRNTIQVVPVNMESLKEKQVIYQNYKDSSDIQESESLTDMQTLAIKEKNIQDKVAFYAAGADISIDTKDTMQVLQDIQEKQKKQIGIQVYNSLLLYT